MKSPGVPAARLTEASNANIAERGFFYSRPAGRKRISGSLPAFVPAKAPRNRENLDLANCPRQHFVTEDALAHASHGAHRQNG
jgi:hypothetical protein